MAKKTSGPVRYHNLAGLMRDLRKALDNGDQESYEFAELISECDELLETPDGGGEDDGDDATDGDSSDVASNVIDVRTEVDARTGGPVARSQAGRVAASILDRALDGLAGAEREAAIRELDLLRMHSVGAPRVAECPKAVKRRGT